MAVALYRPQGRRTQLNKLLAGLETGRPRRGSQHLRKTGSQLSNPSPALPLDVGPDPFEPEIAATGIAAFLISSSGCVGVVVPGLQAEGRVLLRGRWLPARCGGSADCPAADGGRRSGVPHSRPVRVLPALVQVGH